MSNFIPVFSSYGSITDCNQDKSWTPEDISKKVLSTVNELIALGFENGDNIFIKHSELPDFFSQLIAVWSLGGSVSCLNPNITDEELKNLMSFMSPNFLVDKNKINVISGSRNPKENKDNLKLYSFPDKPALILFTSGTTGIPKAVVHSFRSIISRISLNQKNIGKSNLKNTLCLLPMHFGHGLIGNSLTPFLTGSNLFILKNNLENLSNINYFLEKYSISFMSSVPAMWKTIIKLSFKKKIKQLNRVHIGSSPLSADLWNEVIDWTGGSEVVNMYGITETANWFSGASSRDYIPKDGLVGIPWGGQAAILKNEKLYQKGEGEVLISTPSIMSYYFNQKNLTETSFYNGWYKTGDIAEIDELGNILIKGRLKNEINRAGLKVIPEDIDILLEKNPKIMEACCFGIEDDLLGEKVCVAIVLKENVKSDALELKDWMSLKLTREKIPEKWFFINEIPRNDRGKVNRQTVAKFCINNNGK